MDIGPGGVRDGMGVRAAWRASNESAENDVASFATIAKHTETPV